MDSKPHWVVREEPAASSPSREPVAPAKEHGRAVLPVSVDSPTHTFANTERFPRAPPEKAAFTIKEAAAYSGLSRSFIYGLFDQRLLPRLKAGKRVLILRRDLDDYLLSIRRLDD